MPSAVVTWLVMAANSSSVTKALAILAHKSFAALKPGGVKVHGGSVILEKGLVEKDFEEMAKEGVWTVGEIGLGSVKDPADAAPMVEWAHKNGMKVQMHTGGTSIPGSSTVTAAQVMGWVWCTSRVGWYSPRCSAMPTCL